MIIFVGYVYEHHAKYSIGQDVGYRTVPVPYLYIHQWDLRVFGKHLPPLTAGMTSKAIKLRVQESSFYTLIADKKEGADVVEAEEMLLLPLKL